MSPALKDKVQTDSMLMFRAQADDAVQEGFLAIWRSRASRREGVAGFQALAMMIVRNRAIDSTRGAAALGLERIRREMSTSDPI